MPHPNLPGWLLYINKSTPFKQYVTFIQAIKFFWISSIPDNTIAYNSGLKGQLIPAQGNALGKKRYVFSALKGQLNITQGKIFKIEVDSEIPAN